MWTCAHNQAFRRSKDRFEWSLDTVSRKVSHVVEVICRWANYILVLADSTYAGVKWQLGTYAPFFDGYIGALDGTHIKVKVNKEAKVDHINRKGDVSINVCAIVDMDGRFTYVGVGMARSVHDMSVLKECWEEPNFPRPPHGELGLPCNYLTYIFLVAWAENKKLIVQMVHVLQAATIWWTLDMH